MPRNEENGWNRSTILQQFIDMVHRREEQREENRNAAHANSARTRLEIERQTQILEERRRQIEAEHERIERGLEEQQHIDDIRMRWRYLGNQQYTEDEARRYQERLMGSWGSEPDPSQTIEPLRRLPIRTIERYSQLQEQSVNHPVVDSGLTITSVFSPEQREFLARLNASAAARAGELPGDPDANPNRTRRIDPDA